MKLNKHILLAMTCLWTFACSETGFLSGGGARKNATSNPNPDDPFGDIFKDRELELGQEEGDLDLSLYVPMNIYYDGLYSGDDAKFTFYVARQTPTRDRKEVEIIKSVRKRFISATKDKFCKCGKKNEMWFLWRHVAGRTGMLHTRSEGEWIVGHNVNDPKWILKSLGLQTVSQGKHTMFLGADTENPDFITNPTGNGYLRTVNYAPNSIFGNSKKWSHRDDMRLALSCDISQCPEELRDTTELELTRHQSMNP
jgi:hypothetical protein